MAVTFKNDGDVVTLSQTRRGFRNGAAALAVFAVLGAVQFVLLARQESPTIMTCDHGPGTCRLTEGLHVTTVPIASIVGARVERGDAASKSATRDAVWVLIERNDKPRFRKVCGAVVDSAAAAQAAQFGNRLASFLQQPGYPPIELHCLERMVNGPRLDVIGPAWLLGWLVVIALFSRFSVETHVVLDRIAGTIEVNGRGWFRRSWHTKRQLSEVRSIDWRSGNAGWGARQDKIYALFADGATVLLWSPAATTIKAIDQRVAILRSYLNHAAK